MCSNVRQAGPFFKWVTRGEKKERMFVKIVFRYPPPPLIVCGRQNRNDCVLPFVWFLLDVLMVWRFWLTRTTDEIGRNTDSPPFLSTFRCGRGKQGKRVLKKKKSKQWKLNPVSFNKENKCEVRGDRIEERKEETVFY